MYECKCGQKNDIAGKAAGAELLCAGCQKPFTVGAVAEPPVAADIDTWSDEKVAKACRPVLVYYYCNPITDASNPNWVFARKLEMQCFARKDVVDLLTEQFACEKVGIKYELQTLRGKPVPADGESKPFASRWDYRVTKVVLASFDGEKRFMELSAKQADTPHLKSANFTKLLQNVLAANAKYIKDLQKKAAKEREAAKKPA